jgi:acetylornithine deacetylase
MNLLQDLIKINTYQGDYSEIIKCLSTYLKQNTNCKIDIQEIDKGKANLIATFGNPELLINCHMDTVPPADGYTNNPLSLIETDKHYYGLGVADTKGNIYSTIKAVESCNPKNLMLLFSIDEESGVKTGVKYFLESSYKNGIKKAVICEPTSLKLVSKHKGYYSFSVETLSEAKHSSLKSKGAIVKASEGILKLHKEGFNVGVINGGSAGNIVSQKCIFRTSVRTYNPHPETLKKVCELCLDGNVASRFIGPPLINKNPMFEGDFSEVDFWSEASLFQEMGINSIVFGAGNIEQAHTADEFVEKSQLIEAQNLLEKIMKGSV